MNIVELANHKIAELAIEEKAKSLFETQSPGHLGQWILQRREDTRRYWIKKACEAIVADATDPQP